MKRYLLALVAACCLHAQDPLSKLDFLVGAWSGSNATAQGGFSFEAQLDRKILVRRNDSKSADGTRHEDLMVIYLDPAPRAMYFDNEGHVIRYALSFPAPDAVVFESNEGPKYRLSYRLERGVLQGRFEVGGRTYLEWSAVRKTPR